VAIILVAALALGGCARRGGGLVARRRSGATASSAATTTTTVPAPAVDLGRPFSVTRREIVVEDTSRPTAADPSRGMTAQPSRKLPLLILAPDGPGPYGIVMFSHGLTASGPVYAPFLEPIAAAGYIVIAPTYPLSSGRGGRPGDFVNQPADAYFALDSVIKMSRDPADPLAGRVDPDHIAFAGHSLGAMTTVGVVYNSCCAQPRVDAAVVLAGFEPGFPGGNYDHRPATPLLIAHGAEDKTLPIAGDDKLYTNARSPTAFLRFPTGSHTGILLGDQGKLLRTAIIAWLDRWLRADPRGWNDLPTEVDSSGLATLSTR